VPVITTAVVAEATSPAPRAAPVVVDVSTQVAALQSKQPDLHLAQNEAGRFTLSLTTETGRRLSIELPHAPSHEYRRFINSIATPQARREQGIRITHEGVISNVKRLPPRIQAEAGAVLIDAKIRRWEGSRVGAGA